VVDFLEGAFNPMDQHKMQNCLLCIFVVEKLQVDLKEASVQILPLNIPTRAEESTDNDNEATDKRSSSTMAQNVTNLKMLLQAHFLTVVKDMLPFFPIISINLATKI